MPSIAIKKCEGKLTKREEEVLSLIVDGYSNDESAKLLGISIRTIEAHRARVMVKLDLHDLSALVKFALINELTNLHSHRTVTAKKKKHSHA